VRLSEIPHGSGPSIALATYKAGGQHGTIYIVRGFIAAGDICGDLEFYSSEPVSDQDPVLARVFSTYNFDSNYVPAFTDIFQYAQVLFQTEHVKDAAPLFERALAMIPADGAPFPSRKIAERVTTDQAAMAYGMTGNIAKTRSLISAAIERDPDYPINYYNLCLCRR
jgi:hypothetical protein